MRTSKVHSGRSAVPATTKKESNSASAANAPARKARKPAMLPKSDGDAGVQAYIATMEPWQAAIAKRVDALVEHRVPGVRKAMKWHCPFYGVPGQGWFLAFNCFQYHVKFTFFKGVLLTPIPPAGKSKDARSLDVREGDEFDEKLLATWIEQAAAIPGWNGGSGRNGGSAL